MIPLVSGTANTIKLRVEASIDIRGFSAVLAACGVLKTISDISQAGLSVQYTAEEVESMDDKGTFGTLEVYDAEDNLYMTFLPQFKKLPAKLASLASGNQTIHVTIVNTKYSSASDGGGGGGDMSNYATKKEVSRAVSNALVQANSYTDNQIGDIGDVIISTQPVEVEDEEGHPVTMTVTQAVQKVVNIETEVSQAQETHITGHVIDEDEDQQPDDETLYLRPEKQA